jgi:hypothetical protein
LISWFHKKLLLKFSLCRYVLVYVERVYPSMWQETGRPDGRPVHRNDAAEVGLYKLTHSLKAPGFNLKCDIMVSSLLLSNATCTATPRRAR